MVEDEGVNVRVLGMLLKHLGYSFDHAINGCDMFAKLAKQHYGAILLDVMMPDMDGIEAVQRVRRGEAGEDNKTVRIIAVSAYPNPEHCLAAGMDDFVAKPVTIPTIQKALEPVVHLLHHQARRVS